MKSFVTGWMSHSHISYGIIRVGLGTHIGRGTLNPSIGTPIPSIYIWMDGGGEEQKIGEKATIIIKNSYTNFLFISLQCIQRSITLQQSGFHKRKVDGLLSI